MWCNVQLIVNAISSIILLFPNFGLIIIIKPKFILKFLILIFVMFSAVVSGRIAVVGVISAF